MIKKARNIFFEYFYNLVETIVNEDFANAASEMAFMMAIGIFPFMLFLMGTFGWLGKKFFVTKIIAALSTIAPNEVINLIQTVLAEFVLFQKDGTVAIIGFVVTLFLAHNAIATIIKGLNRANRVVENRNFFEVRLLALVMVIVHAFLLFISVNLIIFGKVIVTFLNDYGFISDTIMNCLLVTRWPIAFLMLLLLAVMNYYVLPARDYSVVRKSVLPGSIFFCVFWLLGSWGFSLYINEFGTYNKVYGTIGAFAILMAWLYFTSLILLIGGAINNQTLDKLSSDKLPEIQD